MYCSIRGCTTTARNKVDGIVIHTARPAVKSKWVEKCGMPTTWVPPKSLTICSKHFLPTDYERDLKNELLKLPPRKILKPEAEPSLHLGNSNDNALPFTFTSSTVSVEAELTMVENNFQENSTRLWTPEDFEQLKAEFEAFQKSSTEKINDLEISNKKLTKLLEDANESVKRLNSDNQYLKAAFEKYKKIPKTISKTEKIRIVQEALQGILTKNQIEIMCGNKKYAYWTEEELQTAFTLRYMGKKAYKFVTKVMLIPLPSLSKLHRWAAKMNLQCGNLDCVLNVMKCTSPSFEEAERAAVITFDEMKVREGWEYDQKNDKIIGPHNQMQVAMVRGLFGKWKVPIYLDFDQKMTKEILLDIISKLQGAGYVVRAACSDMGGGNQGLLRDLGISPDITWIPHPTDPHVKIFFFADAPHCLKLVRNWLLDTGFLLSDGSFVDKKPLEALVKLAAFPQNPLEVASCYKLTEAHIKCEKTSRQSVRLAAQLLSHSTEVALERYLPGENPEAALRLSKIVGTINGWFDVFNSYILYSTPLKSAYGTNLEEQDKCLDEMHNLMATMLCGGKTSLQVFQKAIMISIKSLQMLRTDLEITFGKKFILTHRLNQDLLENFFSQIRTNGGLHDHPTPLEAFWRVRMIILGKSIGIVHANNNANALEESKSDGDEFLTATAISILEEALTEDPEEVLPCVEENDEQEFAFSPESNVHHPPTLSDLQEELINDGIEFLAGWVAYKFKKEYPHLGSPTRENINTDHLPSWVQQLSFGGLMLPCPEWLAKAHSIEQRFLIFHGDNKSVSKCPKVVHGCVQFVLQTVSDVPEKVIKTYVLQRTRMRVKFLNAYLSYRKEQEKKEKEIQRKKMQEDKQKRKAEDKTAKEEKAEQEKIAKELKRRKIQEEKQKKKTEDKAAKEEERKKKQEEVNRKKAEQLAAKAQIKRRKLPLDEEPIKRKRARKYSKLLN